MNKSNYSREQNMYEQDEFEHEPWPVEYQDISLDEESRLRSHYTGCSASDGFGTCEMEAGHPGRHIHIVGSHTHNWAEADHA